MSENNDFFSRPSYKDGCQLEVLVVDDSAVVRQVLTNILSQDPCINVNVASDPIIAMTKMKRLRPDVIILDLDMPRMDGLTFLRKLMAEDPIPVVICSREAGHGTEMALRALREGAVEIVAKPRVGVRGFLEESATVLIDAVHEAAVAKIKGKKRPPAPFFYDSEIRDKLPADVILPLPKRLAVNPIGIKLIAIGASAGGTEALREILKQLPVTSPGIVIVQHMPEGFTAAFARQLDYHSKMKVKEAETGDVISEGKAYVAPGNKHTLIRRSVNEYVIEIINGPLISRHRPSVDVLFRSAALVCGSDAVGVILTGMGDDGAQGLLEMKTSGADTVAQDEASSTVFGMPREAINRGAVDRIVPLKFIPDVILDLIS